MHASLRLLDYARSLGITTVCTSLVADEAINETTTTQISTIADTWIHLAYVVHGGERNRTLTIVKSRGMKHSNQVRELLLSDHGITLADVFTAGGTVLVGTARFEQEAKIREQTANERNERAIRRKTAEQGEAKIRAQIAALEAELEAHRLASELAASQYAESETRRTSNLDTVKRLRHADVDNSADDGQSNKRQAATAMSPASPAHGS